MANVYVEARPEGRPEGTRIDDYVVEDHADKVLYTSATQKESIDCSKAERPSPPCGTRAAFERQEEPGSLAKC